MPSRRSHRASPATMCPHPCRPTAAVARRPSTSAPTSATLAARLRPRCATPPSVGGAAPAARPPVAARRAASPAWTGPACAPHTLSPSAASTPPHHATAPRHHTTPPHHATGRGHPAHDPLTHGAAAGAARSERAA
eukprot:5331980-Prymnesium_polylepis.1